jgi:hypothetical protein
VNSARALRSEEKDEKRRELGRIKEKEGATVDQCHKSVGKEGEKKSRKWIGVQALDTATPLCWEVAEATWNFYADSRGRVAKTSLAVAVVPKAFDHRAPLDTEIFYHITSTDK